MHIYLKSHVKQRRSPQFGVFDIQGVLKFVLPGQAATNPLDHAVAHDFKVCSPWGSWNEMFEKSQSGGFKEEGYIVIVNLSSWLYKMFAIEEMHQVIKQWLRDLI